ncbi:MAG: GNAT family N-acetyltransferase [Myxococcales bacterium]|nr:GNAT family N-acetyltransferase [Myxococcales bacterium]
MSGAAPERSQPRHVDAISRARAGDLAQLKALLGGAVPDCAPQTVWELPWTWQCYSVVRARGRDGTERIVACGALRELDEELCELRGVYVAPAFRGRGLAAALIEHLLARAAHGVRRVVCVTRKPELFARHGFVAVAWPSWIDHARRTRSGAPRTAMAYLAERGVSAAPATSHRRCA